MGKRLHFEHLEQFRVAHYTGRDKPLREGAMALPHYSQVSKAQSNRERRASLRR